VRDRCPNLVRQLRTYRYLRSSHLGLNPQDARGDVLKADDHAVDALRYGLYSEAKLRGMTPETIQKQRNSGAHGVQVRSDRFR
jgi:hypothetical protein